MIEGQNLLDRHLTIRGLVQGGGNGSIGALADGVQQLVVIAWNRSDQRDIGNIRDYAGQDAYRLQTLAKAWFCEKTLRFIPTPESSRRTKIIRRRRYERESGCSVTDSKS